MKNIPECVSSALQGPAWGRKPSPNRPGQAGPWWRLLNGFGLACILEKPKPSRQAAAFQYMNISYIVLFSIYKNFSLLQIVQFWPPLSVTHVTHCDSLLVLTAPPLSVLPLPPTDCPFQQTAKPPTCCNLDDGRDWPKTPHFWLLVCFLCCFW